MIEHDLEVNVNEELARIEITITLLDKHGERKSTAFFLPDKLRKDNVKAYERWLRAFIVERDQTVDRMYNT